MAFNVCRQEESISARISLARLVTGDCSPSSLMARSSSETASSQPRIRWVRATRWAFRSSSSLQLAIFTSRGAADSLLGASHSPSSDLSGRGPPPSERRKLATKSRRAPQALQTPSLRTPSGVPMSQLCVCPAWSPEPPGRTSGPRRVTTGRDRARRRASCHAPSPGGPAGHPTCFHRDPRNATLPPGASGRPASCR